jgi:hypothetical protein
MRNEVDRLSLENRQLRNSAKPKLEGLAGLDEPFSVRLSYWNGQQRVQAKCEMTWAQIFLSLGPSLIRPSQASTISDALKVYYKENRNQRADSIMIYDTDEDTIKMHLVALNLISAEASGTVKGGVAEFLSLTDHGQRKLLELSAVKSSKG